MVCLSFVHPATNAKSELALSPGFQLLSLTIATRPGLVANDNEDAGAVVANARLPTISSLPFPKLLSSLLQFWYVVDDIKRNCVRNLVDNWMARNEDLMIEEWSPAGDDWMSLPRPMIWMLPSDTARPVFAC